MNARIILEGSFSSNINMDLQELAEKLSENGVSVNSTSIKVSGAKADLTVGLAIASLAFGSVNTFIAVLNFWRSQKKKVYRVSLAVEDSPQALDESGDILKQALETEKLVTLIVEQV
jgi:hypothetical protein